MYFSTSKNPGPDSKQLARKLARLIPFAVYQNRGKKGVEQLVAGARELGKKRVCLLYEEQGRPETLRFIEVKGKGWAGLKPKVRVKGFSRGKVPGREGSRNLVISGKEKAVWQNLLLPLENEGEESLLLKAGAEKVEFFQGKKKIFWLTVEYL